MQQAEVELEAMPRAPREIADIHPADWLSSLPVEGRESDSAAPAAPPSAPAPASRALLTFTATVSLGGLLFGYDTGVISGALPYLRDELLQQYASDPARLAWVQEAIVSAAIVAGGAGSAAGGLLSDRLGRKRALLLSDALFAAGALAMAAAGGVAALVAGRTLVGLGVGLASVTVPVYIAEVAPPALRGSLVSQNVLFITSGQFLAYIFNYLFSFVPHGAWRWMLGAAALPAFAQAAGLVLLPESPTWLAAHGRAQEARVALALLQPTRLLLQQRRAAGGGSTGAATPEAALYAAEGEAAGAAEGEAASLLHAPGSPKQLQRPQSAWRLLRSPAVLRALHVGVGLQVLQQAAAINTVMYYTPAILELAGVHDKRTVLAVAMIPAFFNAAGTLVGAACIDRFGRRRLLLSSTAGVAAALAALGAVFRAADARSPAVAPTGSTCAAAAVPLADCTACLHAGCGFCGAVAGDPLAPGTCLAPGAAVAAACAAAGNGTAARALYTRGCPSSYTWAILGGLLLYLAAFAPGLGPVPWAVNSEIYPQEVRGLASGAAATANWIANACVAQTFLSLAHALGSGGAFWAYSALALAGLGWAAACVPETAGLPLEEVQALVARQAGAAQTRRHRWRRRGEPATES